MPRVCRAGIDKAGGLILGGSSTVFIDGFPVALQGNRISAHGDSPHNNAIIINGSSNFIIDGIPVCVEGLSKGTCGHIASSTSSVIVP
jgi:uncharacterized Zn-binding protein involved in type VI secretion